MQKAIQLKVTLWIEGEDEPADDFAKYTTQAVTDMLNAGRVKYPKLKVTVKKIVEENDED